MSNVHHIDYIKDTPPRKPYELELHTILDTQLGDTQLQAGDKLRMIDGQLLAVVVNTLSEFGPDLPEEEAITLFAHEPTLRGERHIQSGQPKEFFGHFYAQRTAFCLSRGHLTRQALTKAVDGSPAWVNIGNGEYLTDN